jgi:hypothetical protein
MKEQIEIYGFTVFFFIIYLILSLFCLVRQIEGTFALLFLNFSILVVLQYRIDRFNYKIIRWQN